MRFSNKKVLSFILVLVLTLTLAFSVNIGIGFAAGSTPTYTDVPEDFWAYEAITKWSTEEYRILQGVGGGKFEPQGSITAEQLALLNGHIFGMADEDVTYEGNGRRNITRAEAVAVIAQAFGIEPLNNPTSTFADNASIPREYRGYVNAMKEAGYVQGIGNNIFDPNDTYTRAQALQMVYNMITDITDKNASKVEASDNYIIRTAGVQLKDSTIDGNLIIGHGVGDGKVTLDNVTVNGKLIVYGGGSNSIVVRGKSNIGIVEIFKTVGEAVRIKVEGSAVVKTVTVTENSKAIVNGAITTLTVEGNSSVELQSARVVDVAVNGSDVTVNVDSASTVKTVTIDAADVKLTGNGKVENAVVTDNAESGVVVDTKGTKVDVAEGAGDVTNSSGKVVAESGKTSTTPGTSSSSSSWPSGGSTNTPGGSGSGSGTR